MLISTAFRLIACKRFTLLCWTSFCVSLHGRTPASHDVGRLICRLCPQREFADLCAMSSTLKRRREWEPWPFKRSRSEAGGERVAVTFRTLRAEVLGGASLAATCLGRELKLEARAFAPRGIVTLFHGTAAVKDDVPVGEQGLHGADVLLVVSAVGEAKRNRCTTVALMKQWQCSHEFGCGGTMHPTDWR